MVTMDELLTPAEVRDFLRLPPNSDDRTLSAILRRYGVPKIPTTTKGEWRVRAVSLQEAIRRVEDRAKEAS